MTALFRLQHAVALTRADVTVLGTLLLLLGVGTAGRAWQGEALAFDPALYQVTDGALVEVARAAAPAAPAPAADALEAVAAAAAEPRKSRKKAAAPPVPVNVNAASAEELDRLPGIGPALAARVVAYREAHGPFAAPAHLQRVRGIGAKTFAKMAPFVRVE